MPVLLDYEAKAYDVNERVLELLTRDAISEEQAWLLFLWPGSSTDGTPGGGGCPQGWHRIFPPLPASRNIMDFLRTQGHHLYGVIPDPRVTEVLATLEHLEKEADDREAAEQKRAFLPISARKRARDVVAQQVAKRRSSSSSSSRSSAAGAQQEEEEEEAEEEELP